MIFRLRWNTANVISWTESVFKKRNTYMLQKRCHSQTRAIKRDIVLELDFLCEVWINWAERAPNATDPPYSTLEFVWYHLNTYFMKCKLLMKNNIFKFLSPFEMNMVMTNMMMTMMMVTLILRQMVNLITRPWGEGERRGVACWFCPLLCDKPKLGFTYCSNDYHYHIIVNDKISDVVENWV